MFLVKDVQRFSFSFLVVKHVQIFCTCVADCSCGLARFSKAASVAVTDFFKIKFGLFFIFCGYLNFFLFLTTCENSSGPISEFNFEKILIAEAR